MKIFLTGVLDDGTPFQTGVPTNPRRNINVAQGTTLIIEVIVVTPLGSAVTFNTGGGDSLILTVKRRPNENPSIEKTATIVGNKGTFTIDPADTKRLVPGLFSWDVWATISSARDPVIPLSPWNLQFSNAKIP